jgi:hypothetical protein
MNLKGARGVSHDFERTVGFRHNFKINSGKISRSQGRQILDVSERTDYAFNSGYVNVNM